MRLIDLIRTNAAALTAATAENWQACSDALVDDVIEQRIIRPWNYAAFCAELGEAAQIAARRLMQLLAQSSDDMADAHQLLLLGDGVKTGLRLDLDDRQQQLSDLIAANPDHAELLEGVKRLGRRTVTRAASHSIRDISAAACSTAWNDDIEARAANELRGKLGALQSALRRLDSDVIVGDSLPTAAELTQRIIDHCTAFGATFAAAE